MLDDHLLPEPVPGFGHGGVKKRERLWHNVPTQVAVADMQKLKRQGQLYDVKFDFEGALTNTYDSLRLVLWAQTLGLNEELMTAYGWRHFGHNQLMADHTVLLAAAEEAGLDVQQAKNVLESDAFGCSIIRGQVNSEHLPDSKKSGNTTDYGIPQIRLTCAHPLADWCAVFTGSSAPEEFSQAFNGFQAVCGIQAVTPASKHYKVVYHGGRVAVSGTPELDQLGRPLKVAGMLSLGKRFGVVGEYRPSGRFGVSDSGELNWVKLAGQPGWVAISTQQHGVLLEPASAACMQPQRPLIEPSETFVSHQDKRNEFHQKQGIVRLPPGLSSRRCNFPRTVR